MTLLLLILSFIVPSYASPFPSVENPPRGKSLNKKDAALIISNESYQQFPQVLYATKDGDLMSDVFSRTLRIQKRNVKKLNNANQKKIKAAIKRQIRRVRNGTLWIYYSGHGFIQESGERALLPNDAKDSTLNDVSISFNDIFTAARANKRVKRVVLIADANFGTKGRDNLKVYKRKQIGTATPLPYSDVNEIVWIPSEDQSPSPHFPIAQHGLFTYLVAGAFRGWADGELDGNPDGKLTIGEMQRYVRHKTVALGVPVKPSVFSAPEVESIKIHSLKMEKGPNQKVLHTLSKEFLSDYIEEAAAYIKAKANNRWQLTLQDVQKGGADGEEALKNFLKEYEYATIPIKWAVYVPQVNEARQMLQNYSLKGNLGNFSVEDCSDRKAMRNAAVRGKLTDSQIACIESQIRLNRTQTERSKLSLILINNVQAQKNMKEWEGLVRRHLEQYDRSDPTMCMSFSIYLYQKGDDFFKEALKWANYANENRVQWEGGNDFIQKSNTLFKLRSELSTNIWINEEELYRQERTPENEENAENARGIAKQCAREWLDYTRAADLPDSRKAFDMCVSAARNVDLCRE